MRVLSFQNGLHGACYAALLLASLPAAGADDRVNVQFVLEMKGTAEPPPETTIALRRTDAAGPPVRLTTTGNSPTGIMLPGNSTWEVSLDAPGFWAAQEVLRIEQAASASVQRLRLWRSAVVAGRLRLVEKTTSVPSALTLELDSPPGPPQARALHRQRTPCVVGGDTRFTCSVPALNLDLTLRSEGFVPHYRWGMELEPGRTHDWGLVELRAGASIAGWVAVEEGALEPGQCRVRASPLLAPGPGGGPVAERLQKAISEAKVGGRGFFQIAGLAPGSYLLEAEQPGYSIARAFPLEVWPGAETLLHQPIVLQRPLTLEISLSPGRDWLGAPWSVEVLRASGFSAGFEAKPIFQGKAPPDGALRLPGQAAGTYAISLADSAGNRLYYDRARVVTGPSDAQIHVEVELIWLTGRVKFASEPLAATLRFGGRFGSLKAEMQSDEDGEFEGVLPRAGRWRVDVEALDPAVDSHLETTILADREKNAHVELEVPDTLVFGRVLDEAGQALPDAEVTFSNRAASIVKRTNERGQFEVRGEALGQLQVSAEAYRPDGRLTSDEILLHLEDGSRHGPIELVVRRMQSLRGRVVGNRGPVAGARLLLSVTAPLLGATETARTSVDGSFEARISGLAQAAQVVISPPGHALTAVEIPISQEPLVLAVGEEAGDLEVRLGSTQEELGQQGKTVVILQNGLPLSPSTLFSWAAGHGVPFVEERGYRVPHLAPGEYRVCLGPKQFSTEASLAAWFAEKARCRSGFLGAGGTLTLDLAQE